jgi:hypothetical protein
VLQIVDEYPCRTNRDHRANATHFIIMQGLTDAPTYEASIPTEHVINRLLLGVTVRRKAAKRRWPRPPAAAAAAAAAAGSAKRQRIQEPTSIPPVAADGVVVHAHTADTETSDDTPTDPVTPTASSPSAVTASRAPRRNWKAAEDAKLKEAVQKLGRKWVAVTAMVPGRTNTQCHQRWVNTVNPAIGKNLGKWSTVEDAKLTEAVQKLGKYCWVAVAAMVPGRTEIQCRQRWVNSLDPAMGKNLGKWSTVEDAKLTEAVQKLGKDCWVAVAAMVPDRTNEQCRNKWVRTLDPDRASNTGEEEHNASNDDALDSVPV